jgi:hypothetical protein
VAVRRILMCKSLQGKYPMEIPSESDPGKSYIVIVDPFANRSELHECECGAYRYKGRCKHQVVAHLSMCNWTELSKDRSLDEHRREAMICPKCGNDLVYGLWEIEEAVDKPKPRRYNKNFTVESVPRSEDD